MMHRTYVYALPEDGTVYRTVTPGIA